MSYVIRYEIVQYKISSNNIAHEHIHAPIRTVVDTTAILAGCLGGLVALIILTLIIRYSYRKFFRHLHRAHNPIPLSGEVLDLPDSILNGADDIPEVLVVPVDRFDPSSSRFTLLPPPPSYFQNSI